MSGNEHPGQTPAMPSSGEGAQLCVLLACFAGSKTATNVRPVFDEAIRESPSTVLDEVILRVNTRRNVQLYDPRRTVAGTLTPALTWGLFGLAASGGSWISFSIWALIGAACGGLYAYYTEHLLTKAELARIGHLLPATSSALVGFIQSSDPERVLTSTAPLEPTTASLAVIYADLSARVYSGASHPIETMVAAAGVAPIAADQTTELSMLLVRFAGERAARQQVATSAKGKDPKQPQVELVVEANGQGRRRVIDPGTGTTAMSKSDVVSWGGFGLVYGAIVGFAGNGGLLGSVESGLVVGIAWAIFGLVAGALYGLWAGRGVSARRLKGIGPLVPPDTSMMVAWAGGTVTQDEIGRWAAMGSDRLIVRFNPVGPGALLEVGR